MKNLLLLAAILLVGSLLFYLSYHAGLFNKTPARIEINSTPVARVFLNGEDKGETPYTNTTLKAGSYTVRLVAQDAGLGATPYETTLNLGKGDAIVVSRNFAAAEPDNYGYTLELKKDTGGGTFISIVSDPDTVNITLDGTPQGYTPASKLEISPGTHSLTLSSPGFKSQELSVNTLAGHNLIVKAKLSVDAIVLASPPPASDSALPEASPAPSASASASPIPPVVSKPYVLIEESGTGWLRVRSDPSGSGEELGKADVGTKLPYLGETSEDGWYKVSFEGDTGWVSGKYATLVK